MRKLYKEDNRGYNEPLRGYIERIITSNGFSLDNFPAYLLSELFAFKGDYLIRGLKWPSLTANAIMVEFDWLEFDCVYPGSKDNDGIIFRNKAYSKVSFAGAVKCSIDGDVLTIKSNNNSTLQGEIEFNR